MNEKNVRMAIAAILTRSRSSRRSTPAAIWNTASTRVSHPIFGMTKDCHTPPPMNTTANNERATVQ